MSGQSLWRARSREARRKVRGQATSESSSYRTREAAMHMGQSWALPAVRRRPVFLSMRPLNCDHIAEHPVICYILRYNKPTELSLMRGL